MTKRRVGVLLPYNTPLPSMFDEITSKLFHPMALLNVSNKNRNKNNNFMMKMPYCFTGHGTVQVGVNLGFDVTVMLSAEKCSATETLKACLDNFIDPANPFAGISVQETNETTIAGQVAEFFKENDDYDSALVIWPYQILDLVGTVVTANGEADFVYTHPLARIAKDKVPECIVVAPKDINGSEHEMECANAMSVGTVDDLLKGSFTRVLSMVEIYKEDFEEWRRVSSHPNDISCFLNIFMKGKRGVLINPDNHQGFIT